ncbi:hypothetical protein ILUMI_19319 [Ignelater luminosus]|uniref:Uncharacterized protein n=1 Tax=Ignelater luminosus TaxID=2038154 RepID=A0A8K0CNB7_IGNLU|nr:hypothetical protein ILUMI_19319 [Ignelater luminosus]
MYQETQDNSENSVADLEQKIEMTVDDIIATVMKIMQLSGKQQKEKDDSSTKHRGLGTQAWVENQDVFQFGCRGVALLPREDLIQDIQLVQLNTQVPTSNASLIRIDSNNPEFVEHFELIIIQTVSNVGDNAFALENDVTYPANNNDMLFEPTNFSTPNDNSKDLQWPRYCGNNIGTLRYKSSLSNKDGFKTVKCRRKGKQAAALRLSKLHNGPVPINNDKKKKLMELLTLIDMEF